MSGTTKHICDCESWCSLNVELPLAVGLEILQNGYVVIVDGCSKGPSAGDVLVKKCDGYSIYKPAA